MVSGLVLPIWMAVGAALTISNTSASEETQNKENAAIENDKKYTSIFFFKILISYLSVP